jgi:hypothetical protein
MYEAWSASFVTLVILSFLNIALTGEYAGAWGFF